MLAYLAPDHISQRVTQRKEVYFLPSLKISISDPVSYRPWTWTTSTDMKYSTDFCSNDMIFMILLIDNYKTNVVWTFGSYLKENQFILCSGFEVIPCCWYRVTQYKLSHVILKKRQVTIFHERYHYYQYGNLRNYVKYTYQPLPSLKYLTHAKVVNME